MYFPLERPHLSNFLLRDLRRILSCERNYPQCFILTAAAGNDLPGYPETTLCDRSRHNIYSLGPRGKTLLRVLPNCPHYNDSKLYQVSVLFFFLSSNALIWHAAYQICIDPCRLFEHGKLEFHEMKTLVVDNFVTMVRAKKFSLGKISDYRTVGNVVHFCDSKNHHVCTNLVSSASIYLPWNNTVATSITWHLRHLSQYILFFPSKVIKWETIYFLT